MIKNKLLCCATAVSLVSSVAVFAAAEQAVRVIDQSANPTKAPAKTLMKKKHGIAKKHEAPAIETIDSRTKSLDARLKSLKAQVASLKKDQEYAKSSTSWSKLYAYGPAIATTPIMGKPDYSGFDLYINFPSINEDLALLKNKQKLAHYYSDNHLVQPDRPVIALSGVVEGQVLDSSSMNDSSKNDINLSDVALEVVANVNQWVSGLIKLEYDDSPPATGARVTNSRMEIKRAYITVGNLDQFPLYATIGQMYVPFGAYNYWTITNPLTYTLGKIQERALLVGFNKGGLYGSVFAFEGDSYKGTNTSSTHRNINDWGANLAYRYVQDKLIVDVGASYINNIADSLGMQDNGYSTNTTTRTFQGFKDYEILAKQVPAVSTHALVTYDPVAFAAEYITSVRKFDTVDLTFNGEGARPRALDIEGIYNFKVADKPAFFSLGFDESWDALALNLPKYSLFVCAGTSIFKSTVQSIEFRHDINYASTDHATAASLSTTPRVFAPGNHTRNIITASFKFFF